MTDEQDELLGSLRGLIEEVQSLSGDFYLRCVSDDIPWNAGQAMQAEIGDELDQIIKRLTQTEAKLRKSLE